MQQQDHDTNQTNSKTGETDKTGNNRKSRTNTAPTSVTHPFEPLCNASSRILILGSLPSVLSRTNDFYYGNPQNRFWNVIAHLYEPTKTINTTGEKTALILDHHLALWDVIASCTIKGSADSTIEDVIPNDVAGLVRSSEITHIFANGRTAGHLYDRHLREETGIEAVVLPSTSPANARFRLADLVEAWSVLKEV